MSDTNLGEFSPVTPGLANLHTTGGPPNDVIVRFIRKDEHGKFLVTRDGKSVNHCDEDAISIRNPLIGTRRVDVAILGANPEKRVVPRRATSVDKR